MLFPEAVILEVLNVEFVHVRLVHLIVAKVHENLFPSIQVDVHPVEDVLDQVSKGVFGVLLIVQALHRLLVLQCSRTHALYFVD